MLFSLRTTLRSISLIAATLAFAPGCDDGQIEALGLSAEQIDDMSAEELDELAEIDDLTTVLPPGEPDPASNPDDLREPPATAHKYPATVDEIARQIHLTHSHKRPGTVPGIVNPVHPTHDDAPSDHTFGELANEADDGCDTHADDPDYTNG